MVFPQFYLFDKRSFYSPSKAHHIAMPQNKAVKIKKLMFALDSTLTRRIRYCYLLSKHSKVKGNERPGHPGLNLYIWRQETRWKKKVNEAKSFSTFMIGLRKM